VDDWHLNVQFHNFRFSEAMLLVIPLGTFEEKTSDVGTFLGMFSDVTDRSWNWEEVEFLSINGRTITLATEALVKRSGETSWVGEGGNPEYIWHLSGSPVRQEAISLGEILEPVSESLH